MTYIKKDIKKLIVDMDDKFTLDFAVKKWLKTSIYPKHNIIIKSKNGYYCTNCHKQFYANVRANNYCICPKCKENLLVRFITTKNQLFRDDFRILEYLNGCFIFRGFEVMSIYNNEKFKHYITEYQRLVITKDKLYLLLSNKFKTFLGYNWVNHYDKHIKWRLYDNRYSSWYLSTSIVYLGNIEDDVKNTVYKYCNLTSTIIDQNSKGFIFLLQKILNNPYSYELLTKMGLTNLSLVCDKFSIKGSFEKRFGVPKSFSPFMVKYNITYNELEVLKTLKKKNIRIIRKLAELSYFKSLSNRLDILKALDNGLNKANERIYNEYLNFAEKLKLNMKDKKVLYPLDINEAHDRLLKQVKDIEDKKMVENIKKRYEELKNNIYKDDKYIIYPVPSYTDLLLESKMQNNCVRSYNFKYANSETDLYFMRLLSNIEKSLVTIEVNNNKVVQSRVKNNKRPNKEQLLFIKTWEKKLNTN